MWKATNVWKLGDPMYELTKILRKKELPHHIISKILDPFFLCKKCQRMHYIHREHDRELQVKINAYMDGALRCGLRDRAASLDGTLTHNSCDKFIEEFLAKHVFPRSWRLPLP